MGRGQEWLYFSRGVMPGVPGATLPTCNRPMRRYSFFRIVVCTAAGVKESVNKMFTRLQRQITWYSVRIVCDADNVSRHARFHFQIKVEERFTCLWMNVPLMIFSGNLLLTWRFFVLVEGLPSAAGRPFYNKRAHCGCCSFVKTTAFIPLWKRRDFYRPGFT